VEELRRVEATDGELATAVASLERSDHSLFGPVIVDVVQHFLHTLPLGLGQMGAIVLRGLGGRHGRGAEAPVALLGRHRVSVYARAVRRREY
jgi:hypothetical protein